MGRTRELATREALRGSDAPDDTQHRAQLRCFLSEVDIHREWRLTAFVGKPSYYVY